MALHGADFLDHVGMIVVQPDCGLSRLGVNIAWVQLLQGSLYAQSD